MKRYHKYFAYFISLCLVFSTIGSPKLLLGATNTITLNAVEDLIALANNCTLDTWSQGKKVVLAKDIDLSGSEFKGIPMFQGEFDGQGYTISGLDIDTSGSTQGFFRYIGEEGLVKNLNLEGNILTNGTKKNLGGIAGENAGTIKSCTFKGSVTGESYIGGIAGLNTATGKVISSQAHGIVTGNHYVGGLVGENLGTILNSQNKAKVNNVVREAEVTLENLNIGDNISLNNTENMKSNTDIGGIAGFSTGIIQGCQNYGLVGYPHMGYNIGGIVGRQSGYVNECTNYAQIYGRKDVGGIAGQIEPHITLEFTQGKLKQIRDELTTLDRLMNQMLDDAKGYSNEVSTQLTTTKNHIDSAIETTHSLVRQSEDIYNEAADTINELSSRVSSTLDQITPVIDEAHLMGEDLTKVIDHLRRTVDAIEVTSDEGKEILEALDRTIDTIEKNGSEYTDTMETLARALRKLNQTIGDEAAMKEALDALENSINNLQNCTAQIRENINYFNQSLSQLESMIGHSENVSELINSCKQVLTALEGISTATHEMIGLIPDFLRAFQQIGNEVDLSKISVAGDILVEAFEELIAATSHTERVLERVRNVVDKVEDTGEVAKDVTEHLGEALDDLYEGSQKGTQIITSCHAIISDLADKPSLTIPNMDSEYVQTTDDLNSSLTNIADTLQGLNTLMNNQNELIVSDLKAVSSQFYTVIDLVIDMALEGEEAVTTEKEYHEDISDKDTKDNTQGKIANSTNEGNIEGDVNVGGVTGSMAIEYDFDPEDDVTKLGENSLKFQYLTRAVVRGCQNKGEVVSKKNYTGGIVGRMDLGTVMECEGYGTITSQDGDYIGGIAGASYSHIQDSFAMCVLSGGKNVGGIAGYGMKLTGNYAMVEITEYAECAGAIAGDVEEIDNQQGNYFVDRSIAAIDGISYTQKAEPMSYETFTKMHSLPQAFTNLTLTFVADDEQIAVIPFEFGESLEESMLPEVPKKAGYYGKWPEFNYNQLTFSATLEAIYTPYATVIESTTSETGKALALIEGTFDEAAVLSVTEANVMPPQEAKEDAKVWQVTLSAKELDSAYELRLLVGDKAKCNLYKMNAKGEWQKVNAKQNGSYMITEMEGESGIYCIDYKASNAPYFILGGSVVIGIIILLILKKKRNNKKA